MTWSKASVLGLMMMGLFIAEAMSASPAITGDLQKGKSIYSQLCVRCHGIDGRGAAAVKLNPPPADLTSPEVQEKLDAGLFKSIHDGRKNTAMGTWQYALSDEEINEVIAYIRTLDGRSRAMPRP